MIDMLKRFQINDAFLNNYESLICNTVIPYQEKVLKDELETTEKSHAVKNFQLAAKKLKTGQVEEAFYGMVFQDSDVAKWLEGAAYSLLIKPDKALEERCDAIIDLIGDAQWEDGYLNTYYTVKAPEKRWTNLEEAHELYCAGHMIEAAVAYSDVTGKNKLLDIMCRMADHIYDHFITNATEGYPGHPEVEWALLRLYHKTKNDHYKELATHFIDVRGVDNEYYKCEMEKDKNSVWGGLRREPNTMYSQCHLPVREQTDAVGHAVRAVYLYTAMADYAALSKDDSLIEACRTLWQSITQKRMYVTGAIGSAYEGEAFTEDYHLPNDTAYAETCAAIGLIFFARNMLNIEKNSTYADIMEKAFYNAVLPGMSSDGTKFFYVNPLEVIPGISGKAATHKHALPERPDWFACACCPPNVARLLPSIAQYAYAIEDNTLFSHLYIGGTMTMPSGQGTVKIGSGLPNKGHVSYQFSPVESSMTLTLALRLPAWSDDTTITKNGQSIDYDVQNGYAYITGTFTSDDRLEITMLTEPKVIYSSNRVPGNSSKVAVERGPLIYCAESVDNENDVLSLSLSSDVPMIEEYSDLFNGTFKLKAKGLKQTEPTELYTYNKPTKQPVDITLMPYYTWGNRGLGQMRVWLPSHD